MQHNNLLAFLAALGLTGLVLWGLVYFVNEGWNRLPRSIALIVCILLAVLVIGSPIYALVRWSDRYLAQQRQARLQNEQLSKLPK